MAFPTTAAPVLSNWQYSYNGLTLGASTPYAIYDTSGLDLPNVRTGDSSRAREVGQFTGLDVLDGRDVVITGDVISDGTSLQHAAEALGTAFLPSATTEFPLWVQIPNYPAMALMCRSRKRTVPVDLAYSMGLASSVIQVHADDPRLYASVQSSTVGLGTPLGGLTFPATPPFTFGGGTVAGIITANNAGNFETRPILTLTGPMTKPTIFNATTGWSITIISGVEAPYTINAGDTMVIDTDLHSVQYFVGGTGAGATRRAWIAPGSTWPSYVAGIAGLAPGSNTVQFTSQDASTVAGTLQMQWCSAFMI